jgi:hypothetical protein
MALFHAAVAFAFLLQGLVAEQRALLRANAKRSKEATPLITLPQSLLLQGESDGKEDKAGGYASSLLDSIRDSAEEVVDDARNVFFAKKEASAVVATTTTIATTSAITTPDPATYAEQHNMTLDAAKSRIMLIEMIQKAQVDLMNRLQEVGLDLEATDARAKYDLMSLNQTAEAAKSMPIMANNADADVTSVQVNALTLLDGIGEIVNKTTDNLRTMDELERLRNATQPDYDAATNLASGQRRVEANAATMHALVPRLMQLQRRIARLESSLNDGNVSRMVDDTANEEVMNLMEDVSRAFGRFIRNKRT